MSLAPKRRLAGMPNTSAHERGREREREREGEREKGRERERERETEREREREEGGEKAASEPVYSPREELQCHCCVPLDQQKLLHQDGLHIVFSLQTIDG